MHTRMNNNGMSLLELIISMAISVIVVLMIVTFISGALRIFRNTNDEVNLQMQAQTSVNQLVNLAMEATNITKSNTVDNNDRYRISNSDAVGTDYAVIFDKDNKKLYLYTIGDSDNINAISTFDDKENLLAEYVADFSITGDDGIKTINMKLQLGNDEYSVSKKVKLRNF